MQARLGRDDFTWKAGSKCKDIGSSSQSGKTSRTQTGKAIGVKAGHTISEAMNTNGRGITDKALEDQSDEQWEDIRANTMSAITKERENTRRCGRKLEKSRMQWCGAYIRKAFPTKFPPMMGDRGNAGAS